MRNVMIAGLLGGLLGGVVSYTAGRLAPARSPAASIPNAEAKAIPEGLMAKLKANDMDGFATAARGNMYTIPDTEFAAFKTALTEFRQRTTTAFGKSLGECELIREQSAGPDVARMIYLEKFEKGGVAWYFQLYRGSDGWKLASVNWDHTLNFAFAGAP
ncbi:MAG TPA: hypothetical protein VKE74_32800 [Gemmataceae bacterium]|nr:hypothetical protein [Gemmataceae bacterium]